MLVLKGWDTEVEYISGRNYATSKNSAGMGEGDHVPQATLSTVLGLS